MITPINKLTSIHENQPVKVSMESDTALVENVKNKGCDESYKRLVEKHSALFHKIYIKFENALKQKGFLKQDFLNDKDYLFFKAISSFQENKNVKFNTWLGNQVRYYCLHFLNDKRNLYLIKDEKLAIRIKELINRDLFSEQAIDTETLRAAINSLENPIYRDLLQKRYMGKNLKTWKVVGQEIGYSPTWCLILNKKAIEALKLKLKEMGHI